MRKQEKGITLIALIITIVVLLILAVVSIKAVQDGGIITHAQNAASKMNKAQIEEKANLTKLEYTTECYTDKNLKKSVQEFRERLIKAFGAEKRDTNNDNIIEVNDKYAVVIKNTDLDIEVVEITNALKASSLISLTYEIENAEESGQVYGIDVKFTITKLMEKTEYNELKLSEVSNADKENTVILYLNNSDLGEDFTSIDEFVVWCVNSMLESEVGGEYNYTTIKECLEDKTVNSVGVTTEEELYYALFKVNSKEEFIDAGYKEIIDNSESDFDNYTKNLILYVKINGEEEKILNDSINPTETVNYPIKSNDTYEFILKTESGIEITREILHVRNIINREYALTNEEANGVWTTNGSGTITKYTGSKTEVVVPLIIGTEKITSIGREAFKDTKVASVIIPEGITTIGNNAFYNCWSLTNITIPNTVTSIEYYAFWQCRSLTSITIPDSVTSIGSYAFSVCGGLTSVVIPGSVSSIENSAFSNCSNLTNVTISEGVTSIGQGVFQNCTNLTEITIPESVTFIGYRTFSSCTNLTSVTILGNITSMSGYSFANCTNLTDVKISEGTTLIGNYMFENCIGLANITIPGSVTSIGMGAFYGCKNLKNVELLEGINSIQGAAFNGCIGLTEIIIPKSVTSMISNVFNDCTNLANIYYKGDSAPSGSPWGAKNATVSKYIE